MNKILLTGATGYIGGQLLNRLLQQGMQVYALARSSSDLSSLPQNNKYLQIVLYDNNYQSINKIFTGNQINAVFHTAAMGSYDIAGEDIAEIIAANINLGTYLLHAMANHNCPYFINTGTYWQHYQGATTYSPVCLYAAAKQAFEAIIDYYVAIKKMSAITIKLFDVYGPNDKRKKLFALLFAAAKNNTPLSMSLGEQLLDLVYIDDVIAAYLQAYKIIIEQPLGSHKRYFVGTGKYKSLREVVELYQKLLGKPVPVKWGDKAYRDREVMQPSLGEILPGWQANVYLTTGLSKLIEAQKSNCK